MTDMLVKLYALPEVTSDLNMLTHKGLEIRRPHASEKHVLSKWVQQHFADASWAAGCEVALENRPVSCYIAVKKSQAFASSQDPYENCRSY